MTIAHLVAPGRYPYPFAGNYMHAGGHGTVPTDWDVYLKFLTRHLKPEA